MSLTLKGVDRTYPMNFANIHDCSGNGLPTKFLRNMCHMPKFSKYIVVDSISLQWRHNECDGVSNHQPHDCLLNHLFRRRSKKAPKLRVTGLCAGNSPVTGEFPAQMASAAENVSLWWRHHAKCSCWHGHGGIQSRPAWYVAGLHWWPLDAAVNGQTLVCHSNQAVWIMTMH